MITLERLRHRLVFANFALVVGVASLFCAGVYLSFELAEDNLFDTHLSREIASLMTLYEHDPALIAIPHENLRVFMITNGSSAGLPDYLVGFDPADDEVIVDGVEFHVELHRSGANTFYFMFDESAFESFENVLFLSMGGLVAVVLVIAGWLSLAIAGRVIRPLSLLSEKVAALDEGDGTEVDFDAAAGNDEIAVLARAIARYHQRISALLHREREFSADVSHELRTPLMGIQGAAEILDRRTAGQDGLAELTARIRRGCQHMTSLTEALLYLARDPASFRDMIEPVCMQRVVEKQLAAVREVAARKNIKLNVETSVEPVTVATIPAVADIVIGNILKNAVKYTDRNVISIYITPREVVIQDYGPGIDASVQEALFDRFNRGEARGVDGAGIGLALVRRFCDQYGWAINFRSESGKGTRIAVVFEKPAGGQAAARSSLR